MIIPKQLLSRSLHSDLSVGRATKGFRKCIKPKSYALAAISITL